jgi:ethanolamine permease
MKIVVGTHSGWLHMLVWIGLFGLIASFHGIIMGYSRQMFALSRAGFLPPVLATLHPRRKTPHWAIIAGGIIGIAAIYSDRLISFGGATLTANIVTISAFGALVMYIMSMLSLFRLRRREPNLERPFKAPLYPYFPGTALIMASISLLSMAYYNRLIFSLFVALLALFWLFFRFTRSLRAQAVDDPMLDSLKLRSDR